MQRPLRSGSRALLRARSPIGVRSYGGAGAGACADAAKDHGYAGLAMNALGPRMSRRGSRWREVPLAAIGVSRVHEHDKLAAPQHGFPFVGWGERDGLGGDGVPQGQRGSGRGPIPRDPSRSISSSTLRVGGHPRTP